MTAGMDVFEEEQDAPEEERELAFPNAGAWVEGWFLPHFRRNPKMYRWDPCWWRYEEVGAVLEAMWASWEQSRIDPDPRVMAAWFRDVFYPLSDRLTAADGPFWNHNEAVGRQDVPGTFPATPAPDGWFA